MKRLYLALVHHPVRDREGRIVTTAVTNLDVHDLARLTRTYDLAQYFVVTPIAAQRTLVGRILSHWREGPGLERIPERGEALSRCTTASSIAEAVELIREREGAAPKLAATAARLPSGMPPLAPVELRERMRSEAEPWLLLFGTGHGLAQSVLEQADVALAPIRPGGYNHLSVRAAVAVTLDRLLGDER